MGVSRSKSVFYGAFVWAVAYAVLVCTALNFTMMTFALRHLNASTRAPGQGGHGCF
jgi:hypothetical protein